MKMRWSSQGRSYIFMVILLMSSLLLLQSVQSSEDFYDLLGIERDASAKDIRRAFKKLALAMHPDKNPDDPEAHAKFVKINRAYEVLKDEDLRKKYDRFGEEGLKEDGQRGQWNRYESWQFYKTEFGLYDEDPEIVTLSKSDFEQSVFGEDVWLVNFYSPRCHHCHDLAPTWREFAKELEGVIRIGAVNCYDDRPLCTQQQVRRFPTLIQYPKEEEYTGPRKLKDLVRHALRQVKATVNTLFTGNFKKLLLDPEKEGQPWLISFCFGETDEETGEKIGCLDSDDLLKLAAILNKVVNIGSVDCVASAKLCQSLNLDETSIRYYTSGKKIKKPTLVMELGEPKHIANEVLQQLPSVPTMTGEELLNAKGNLANNDPDQRPLVAYFFRDQKEPDLELRKLPYFLPDFQVVQVNCSSSQSTCQQFHLTSTLPKAAFFRPGGEHEFHHGRLYAPDIAKFAKDSFTSPIHILGPDHFPDPVTDSGDPWFVDFFSPHCPPCRQLLPEIRKLASQMTNINFGSVDCTIHRALCNQQNVRSYPTVIMYNDSKPHVNVGFSQASALQEFVEDTLNPKVVFLTAALFTKLIKRRPVDQLWLVDFYAPWCGPCQQLAPEWRRLAKRLNGTAHVASVNCDEQTDLCNQQSIRSYPTIRAYPYGQTGTSSYSSYSGWMWDASSLVGWAYQFLPSNVHVITKENFREKVLRSQQPWIIDFYSPWCGPCQQYMPVFEEIATAVKGYVNAGKINCQQYQQTCMQASIRGYPTVRLYKGTNKAGYSQNWYGEDVSNKYPEQFIPFLKMRFKTSLQDSASPRDEL